MRLSSDIRLYYELQSHQGTIFFADFSSINRVKTRRKPKDPGNLALKDVLLLNSLSQSLLICF